MVEKDVADLKRKWTQDLALPGGARWLIAAHDSPDIYKEAAHYVCDGQDDQEEIHAALVDVDGDVVLAPGIYVISDSITFALGRLVGLGSGLNGVGAQIVCAPGGIGDKGMVVLSDYSAELVNVAVWGSDFPDWNDVDVKCLVELQGGLWSSVRDCWVSGGTTGGVYANDGILVSAAADHLIENCVISHVGGYGVNFVAGGGKVSNCRLQGCGKSGVRSVSGNGTTTTVITGNSLLNNGDDTAATAVERASVFVQGHDVVVGNVVTVQDVTGIYVDGVRAMVSDNIIAGGTSSTGISVSSNADEASIAGNNISSQAGVGILLDGCERCIVEGNYLTSSNGANGIKLAVASYNTVIANKVYGYDAATDMDAGIKVVDAGCVSNVVCGNDLSQGIYATAPIVDLGTGTVLNYPAHATYGDNFT